MSQTSEPLPPLFFETSYEGRGMVTVCKIQRYDYSINILLLKEQKQSYKYITFVS